MNQELIHKILLEILEEIKPEKLLQESLQKKFKNIINKFNKIYIFSLGKAGFSMAKSFYDFLKENQFSDRIYGGFVVTPYGTKKNLLGDFEIIEASHPYPDENSLYAGERLLQIAKGLPLDVVIIVLLSGGASALVEKPVEGISLEILQNLTKVLLNSGAPIQEINTIRKKFSLIKGGGFAKVLYPRPVYQFILNDVVGKHTEKFVSSGLLYPEKISLSLIKKIFKKYKILIDFHLEDFRFPEKNQSSVKRTFVIGNNQIACEKTKLVLENHNFTARILKTNFSGTIQEYESLILKSIQKNLKKIKSGMAYIWGGEPTIKVSGSGKGGRNQELALRMAIQFYKNKEFKKFFTDSFIFVSFGTDGMDGPTDAAGAMVTRNTYSEIIQAEHFKKPEEFLFNNDSYNAFILSNSLIRTGYTGTNLNDIAILFVM